MDEAMDDPQCAAVCICVENNMHELMVQQALAAGKHVCVEYPVALDLESAHALFELADKHKLILHVEHIELMSGSYRALREQVLNHRSPCLRAQFGFCGPLLPDGWGWIAHAGIARLHRIRDMFGEDLQIRDFMFLRGIGAAADKSSIDAGEAESMSVTFRNSAGADILWTEWRSPGLSRANTVNFKFTDKSEILEMPKVPNSVPLFLGDLEIFLQKVSAPACSRKMPATKAHAPAGWQTKGSARIQRCDHVVLGYGKPPAGTFHQVRCVALVRQD